MLRATGKRILNFPVGRMSSDPRKNQRGERDIPAEQVRKSFLAAQHVTHRLLLKVCLGLRARRTSRKRLVSIWGERKNRGTFVGVSLS
jgi:hypothetical protein